MINPQTLSPQHERHGLETRRDLTLLVYNESDVGV